MSKNSDHVLLKRPNKTRQFILQTAILNNFLNKVPIAIALFNQDGDLRKANDPFRQKFEIESFDSCRLTTFLNIDEQKLIEINNKLRSEHDLVSYEHCFERNDGTNIWFQATIFLEERVLDKHPFFVLIINDMTSMKSALEEINDKELLLNSFNENISEGLYRKVQGKGFVYVNRSFLDLFGFDSLEEVENISIVQLCAEENVAKKLKHKLREQGFLRNEQVKFKKKDGGHFWGLINATSNTDYKGIKYYNGAIIDITEQKAHEDLLKTKNKELSYAREQIDRLLYSTSHDLIAPTSSLEGLLNIMNGEFEGNDNVQGYISKLSDCVTKMKSVIEGVSTYTKYTRKRLLDDRISVKEMVDKVVMSLYDLPHYQDIEFTVDCKSDLPFFTDYEMLELALKNVISNAIQFHDFDKEKSFILIKAQQSMEKLIIEVIDNGKGIPKPYVQKVFGMFYKATSESKGAGLGLYIVKETISSLGGTVSIDSSLGAGTIFCLEVPNGAKGKLIAKKLLLKQRA